MPKLETTLSEEIDICFDAISEKIESYQGKLEKSLSHFETDKDVSNLIKSQRLLQKLSHEYDKSLE